VNVLGHEHEGHQTETLVLARFVDGTSQNATPGIVCEKRLSSIAGKCEFVEMPQSFEVLHTFSVWAVAHCVTRIPHWQSQWHTLPVIAGQVQSSDHQLPM